MRQVYGLLETFNRVLVIFFALAALGVAIDLALQPTLVIRWSESVARALQTMPANALEDAAIVGAICALVELLVESRHRSTGT